MRIPQALRISNVRFRIFVSFCLFTYLLFLMRSNIVGFLSVVIPTIVSVGLNDFSYEKQKKKDIENKLEHRTQEIMFSIQKDIRAYLDNFLRQEVKAEIASNSTILTENASRRINSRSAASDNYARPSQHQTERTTRNENAIASNGEQMVESIVKKLTKSHLRNTYHSLRDQRLISERLLHNLLDRDLNSDRS